MRRARSLEHSDKNRVYLKIQYSFNIASCYTGWDRLLILQSIRSPYILVSLFSWMQ